jgi:RND family efflux transporter MFP subunit
LPCAAHWHESADLYARVSGYLKAQNVDIGSSVRAGDVLVQIEIPELERDLAMEEATHAQAIAEVAQLKARHKSVMAEARGIVANGAKAEADVARWTAEQTFRQKEFERFRTLGESQSVQAAVVEEKRFQMESAIAGLRAAEAALTAIQEEILAAEARVELAAADIVMGEAKADVAAAGLEKARLFVSFGQVVAPYDGVITARNYHLGEFVRAATQGSDLPLLEIARTDLIRVVAHVPDKEVRFAQPGDKAHIEFDALPGRAFEGVLSRTSLSEDRQTRTMRIEVDLPNTDNQIVGQMYGRLDLDLEPAGEGCTIPSACLVGDAGNGNAKVFIVDGEIAQLQDVSVGSDDGVSVHVVGGVTPQHDVILSPPSGLQAGAAVSARQAASPRNTR